MEIFYEKEIKFSGIGGLRFGTTDSFLNEIGSKYRTECYCNDMAKVPKAADGCLLKGALDLSACHGKLSSVGWLIYHLSELPNGSRGFR